MIRPEVVKQLECPSMGLAASWAISRRSVPCKTIQAVRDVFKREHWPYAKGKVSKSNAKAIGLREKGNQSYKNAPNNPELALAIYNESICMAEYDSEELGLAYANRSAVYFNRQMYRECLDNIKLAKRHHYPEQFMHKINGREEKCMKKLENSTEQASTVDEKCDPSTESCLKKIPDTEGIRPDRDVRVGEKILHEKPFVLILDPEVAYRCCEYCGSQNGLNLRPCKDCTAVMYCDENCQEQALKEYHRFECEIVDDLKVLFRGPKDGMRCLQRTLRLFWKSILRYLEDPDTFLQRCNSPARLLYGNLSNMDPWECVRPYPPRLMQGSEERATCHDDSAQRKELTGRCVTQYITVLMYALAIEENTSLANRLEGTEINDTFRNLLATSVYTAGSTAEKRICVFHTDALCMYPISGLFRHSCAPNAAQFFHGTKSVVVLKRPVKEGQEITIAYDENISSNKMSRKVRREELFSRFDIAECDCEGCRADYPTLHSIENDDQLTAALRKIRTEADETRKRNDLRDFLEQYDAMYPKRELAEAWEMLVKFVTTG